ncbi:hypothetical protein [Caulobacter sp. NIBR2454]|uniref:hypothetical protein n=1 Tax=Caulobacter sp. NIBR2454 TaxID=3015996 RepID=UPI0022B62495|nr:hypothetical protein [Caulobacter sp. NIBR2454]
MIWKVLKPAVRKVAGALLGVAFAGMSVGTAAAGQLVLKNTSQAPITCTVDGWTVATGAPFDWYVTVNPGEPFYVGPNTQRAGGPVINWAQCGALKTRAMAITPSGPDQTLVLNGQQTRVLNASLYAYLPTLPGGDFTSLVAYVVQTYQAQNPQVLLNAVMNPNLDIYDYGALPGLLGPQGFDVMELDMLYLGFLASQNLINPATITGEAPLDVARAAASYNGQLWAIPSWLCMDFIYSPNAAVQQATTLDSMVQFLSTMPAGKPELGAVYNGSWRLPSIYINSYVQTYGYGAIAQATQMPPAQAPINNLIKLTDTCAVGSTNNCTNGVYKSAQDNQNGSIEKYYATGQTSGNMDFSEQTFYVNLYGDAPIYVTPGTWGNYPQPLLYADAFVSSSANCQPSTPCGSDATAFTTLMTGVAMKNYITSSQDLPAGTPWRTLLVANANFWNQPQIQNNGLYRQFARVLPTAQPFPNTITAEQQTQMKGQVCTALQAQRPAYACTPAAQTAAAGDQQGARR